MPRPRRSIAANAPAIAAPPLCVHELERRAFCRDPEADLPGGNEKAAQGSPIGARKARAQQSDDGLTVLDHSVGDMEQLALDKKIGQSGAAETVLFQSISASRPPALPRSRAAALRHGRR